MTDVETFKKIVFEMVELFEKKNSNYGNSFEKLYKELGSIAGLVPLHNKLSRVTNIIRSGKNDFESLEDTFKDLAVYSIMNLIELYREHADNKPVKKKVILNEDVHDTDI